MRRLSSFGWLTPLSHRAFCAVTPAFLSPKPTSPDSLDDIFSEMEGVETSSGLRRKGSRTSHSPRPGPKGSAKSVKYDPSPAEREPQPTRAPPVNIAKTALQRAVNEAIEEERELLKEHEREERARKMERCRPTTPARTFLSTGEMVADKAPQHFVPVEEEPRNVPELTHPGTAGVISLVGTVVRQGSSGGDTGRDEAADGDGEPVFELGVEYAVPFLPKRGATEVVVRCVGVTLAKFAKERVRVGDLVHVLGHLVPVAEDGKPCCQVYVLPLGGNVSVVARVNE